MGLTRLTAGALGIVVAAGLAAATPAGAQPGAEPATPTVEARHTLTLISGDVVELRVLSTGDLAAAVEPNPSRQHISYATRRIRDQFYLVPSDASPLVAAGKLDEELFNLTGLLAGGLGDADSPSIPLIVQYDPAQATATATAAPAGTTGRFTLESINAVSVRGNKAQASSFWSTLAGGATALAGSVRKVWLNRRVTAALTESVPQVGAPQAWAGGHDGTGTKVAVLDSGIDTLHPDLDGGKVTAEANFSTDTDTIDHFGHGTHVASIVAGTGEAAPAVRKGVAPGASLLNAKVLNSRGDGTFDGIIEGLEWAAAQGADVANLSLGTRDPAEGDDPVVQAVNAISKSSGMLVVVSSGNLGERGDSTITSPGRADEALTVGAVDRQDALAGFSSRGPRLGDNAIKPDLTGPGVEIVAARAAGTELGPIVDGTYQQLSGTSMAAPHVAGAAAILAQRFPGYTNNQLKDALVSTARTSIDQTVYEQGGGRLDAARAYAQQVYASPGTLNLGRLTSPKGAPVTKTVSYTNDTAAEVTLELTLEILGKDSGPPPDGMFTVSHPRVTVPAGATVSVTVTVNPAAGLVDLYGGYLVGRTGDTVVHTSVGAYLEPELHNVTVTGIARDGRPAELNSVAELWNLETGSFAVREFSPGSSTVTFRVPLGTYNLAGFLATADAANALPTEMAFVAQPQLEITKDQSVTLDGRTANQIVLNTHHPTAPSTFTLAYHRDAEGGSAFSSRTMVSPVTRGYAAPTAKVAKGNFEFYSKWALAAPTLRMDVVAPRSIPLSPLFMGNSPPVDGQHTLPLAHVGSGRPQDYAGRDVHGRIALIQRTEGMTFNSQIVNAARAGARAALIVNDRPGLLRGIGDDPGTVPIWAFGIERDAGRMLIDLLQHRPVRLRISGTSVSPYVYDLVMPERQRIPRSLAYTVDRSNTAEIDGRYAADRFGQRGSDYRIAKRPYSSATVDLARALPLPLRRTDYVSANDTLWLHPAFAGPTFAGEFRGGYVQHKPRSRLSERYFGRVSRPGASAQASTQVTRTGDRFRMAIFPLSDSGGHWGLSSPGDVYNTKLYAGTQLLYDEDRYPNDTFPAVAEPATYRLVFNGKRSTAWSRYSSETNTTWTFASRRPAEGTVGRPPLLQVDYQLALDDYNQAPDRRRFDVTMDVGYLPGASGPGRMRVQAWASFDDGASWKKLDLRDLGGGKRKASVPHPRFKNTSGSVSLRVTATDAAGNSIDQTVYRAYGLTPTD